MKIKQTPDYDLVVGDIVFDLNPLDSFAEVEASCFEVMEIHPDYDLIRMEHISGPVDRYLKSNGLIPMPIYNNTWYVLELENVDVN